VDGKKEHCFAGVCMVIHLHCWGLVKQWIVDDWPESKSLGLPLFSSSCRRMSGLSLFIGVSCL
jgi:hypothetical protein